MKIVSLITARGGSKGIPLKNLVDVNGKPLIYYSINASLQSSVDETWVTTDSKEIADVSKKYEAKVLPKVKKKLDKIKGISKQQAEILASIPQPTLISIIQQLSTLTMELDPKKDDAGDYIDDFRQSDAPQFKGKSDAKIRKMAIAAYLDAKDKK